MLACLHSTASHIITQGIQFSILRIREMHSTTRTTKTQYDLELEEEQTAWYAHSAR